MIREATTRAWVVATKPIPPSKQQFYSGQCDGASKFFIDPRMSVPLTFSEARQVTKELETMFTLQGDKFEVVYLGDVWQH